MNVQHTFHSILLPLDPPTIKLETPNFLENWHYIRLQTVHATNRNFHVPQAYRWWCIEVAAVLLLLVVDPIAERYRFSFLHRPLQQFERTTLSLAAGDQLRVPWSRLNMIHSKSQAKLR
jgi:hypothetical protein